ncbi:uncharacterized protein SPSK_11027 [Sporothrix schenckii 1099-18]|uniref:Uncharacterized protein n=1 Tax=Sporothrix schenckii 1099-18 TaxID=1397361 RepID=A0A0F2MB62_SPOSC|nr:uncharacterized protein SPSK_11027 [Sporothrix schenckii 1099-18]KJR86882.1 hypothetical protein SPSK_11027 [Sporothrix schenckii 1099-18]
MLSQDASGTPEPDTVIESCGVPVDQYFWLNSLHPTYPIHDVVAEQVSKALTAGPNVCSSAGSTTKDSST